MRLKGKFRPPSVAIGKLPIGRFKTKHPPMRRNCTVTLAGGPLDGTRIPTFSPGTILPFTVKGAAYDCKGAYVEPVAPAAAAPKRRVAANASQARGAA